MAAAFRTFGRSDLSLNAFPRCYDARVALEIRKVAQAAPQPFSILICRR
jgi:hypothetical protein